MTRAKKKIYFQLTKNNDDIHNRFKKLGSNDNKYSVDCPIIKKQVRSNKLFERINDTHLKKIIEKHNLEFDEEFAKENEKKEEGCDFTDHCMRYMVYKTILHFVLNRRHNGQTFHKYKEPFKKSIKKMPPKDYWKYINDNSNGIKDLDDIPLLEYNNDIYIDLTKTIIGRIENISEKFKELLIFKNYSYCDIEGLELSLSDYILIAYIVNISFKKNIQQ